MTKLRTISLWSSVILLACLFQFAGNSSFIEDHGRSLFTWLYNCWTSDAPGIDYSHGPLVAAFCIYLVYRNRKALTAGQDEPYIPALPLLVFALIAHLIGMRIQYAAVSAFALSLGLFATSTYFLGRQAGRHLLFPCLFFMLAVPWPLVENLSFPLRIFAAKTSCFLLQGLAVPVVSKGTAIIISTQPLLALEVADPCSGMRSIMALSALAAGWAYMKTAPGYLRLVFFASAIPVAIAANVVRIVSVCLLSLVLKTEATLVLYHDFSGYLVFLVAVIMLMLESRLCDIWTEKRAKRP